MKSFDRVEAVIAFEETCGVELPDHEPGDFGSPREMVAWLDLHVSNHAPKKKAAALLRKLAKDEDNPELAKRLEGTWRREQIAQSCGKPSTGWRFEAFIVFRT